MTTIIHTTVLLTASDRPVFIDLVAHLIPVYNCAMNVTGTVANVFKINYYMHHFNAAKKTFHLFFHLL